jgi:uncharacterized protein with PQ loop repeat
MKILIDVFAVLATVFLLLAAWGLVHQAVLNFRVKSTEAVSPIRYAGILLANVIWVLIAISTPTLNIPLLLGCGAMMIGSSVVLGQMFVYPPKRSTSMLISIAGVILLSYLVAVGFGFGRELLFPYSKILGAAGVITSFFMIHLGTLDQFRLNRKRKSVENLSFQKEILHLCDWGTWVIYPVLLGLTEHWPPFVNAVFGFICTILILIQFRSYPAAASK